MSWDEMRTDIRYFHCGCNNGRVTETTITEENDWNQFREFTRFSIECPSCAQKFHLEGKYLVPNGLTISMKLCPSSKPYECNIGFKVNVLGRYTPEEIMEVVNDMKNAKNNSYLKLPRSKEVSQLFYRAYKRKSLSKIIPELEDLLLQYDQYENNHYRILEKERLEQLEIINNRKKYDENINKCIELVPIQKSY